MKNNVFSLLCDHENEYISGEYMSGLLSISRAAIWKRINSLKEDGAEIESVTNKGYRMLEYPDVLKPEYLEVFLPEMNVFWKEEVDSTNSWAKKLAETTKGEFITIAEMQTQGRGRRGRSWVSPLKENLYITFLFRPDLMPQDAPGLTLAAALGVCDAVEEVLKIECKIKWPNDIIVDDKKICGILTEMTADMDGINYVAVGIGINANLSEIPEFLEKKATSLRLITGKKISRIKLCASLAKTVEKRIRMMAADGLKSIMPEYEKKSLIVGKEIYAISGETKRKGLCVGFGETGTLLFKENDEIEEIQSGEISIRGLDSYV